MRRRSALLSLAGFVVASAQRGRAADLLPVQVGVMAIEGAAQAFYADELGYFKANGLDVTLNVLPNGSAIIAGIVQGSLNIGFGSPPSLILARQRSLPVRYISYAPIFTGGAPLSAVMVAKNSPVKSGADLNGKIVAVAGLHDVGSYQVAAWIDQTGGDSSTVKFVELPYAEMGAALEAGRVAAAGNTEPFITAAKSVARIVGNMNTAVAPRYLMAGWSSTDGWLQQHPETAKRFIAAMQQAARWANTHPKESATMLERYTKIPSDVVAVMARDTFDESTRPDPKLLQPVIDLMMKYGKLAPFSASDLLWVPPR